MKMRIKNFVNRFGLTFLVLLAALFWTVGCVAPKPTADPLVGWKGGQTAYEGCSLDKAVVDDYRDYIQKLAPEARNVVNDFDIRCYEDETGQRAVKISIPLHGAWLENILIYDKENKRIKVITYSSGRYAS